MNKQQAMKLAERAMNTVKQGDYQPVADATVLIHNADGTYSVTDNGEEVNGLTRERAIEVIVENLTAK